MSDNDIAQSPDISGKIALNFHESSVEIATGPDYSFYSLKDTDDGPVQFGVKSEPYRSSKHFTLTFRPEDIDKAIAFTKSLLNHCRG